MSAVQKGPCEFRDEAGRCKKWGSPWGEQKPESRPKCRPGRFDYRMGVMERDAEKVCASGSLYGNFRFAITDQQIEDLKAGKVLYFLDEYGIFIAREGE